MADKINRVSACFGVPVFTAVAKPARAAKKTGELFRQLATVVVPFKGIDAKIVAGFRGEIVARQPKGVAKAHAEFRPMNSYYLDCIDIPTASAAEWESFKGEVMDRYLAWSKETGNTPQAISVTGVELDMSLSN